MGRLEICMLLINVAVQVILPNLQLFPDGSSLERSYWDASAELPVHVHAVRSDCADADLSCTLLLGIFSFPYVLQNHFSVSVLDIGISQLCAWILTLVPLLYHIHPSATEAQGKSGYSQSPAAERARWVALQEDPAWLEFAPVCKQS